MTVIWRRIVSGRTVSAYHEAGHAVVARALGYEAEASVRREPGLVGRVIYCGGPADERPAELYWNAAVRSLAGPLAEHLAERGDAGMAGARFRGVTITRLSTAELREVLRVQRRLNEFGWSDDYRKAATCAVWLGKRPSWLLTAAREAHRILLERWPELEEERRRLMSRPRTRTLHAQSGTANLISR
jgi:hypothetical protein